MYQNCIVLLFAVIIAAAQASPSIAVFQCEESGAQVDRLKHSISAKWWIELGDKLIALHGEDRYLSECRRSASYPQEWRVKILQRDAHTKTPQGDSTKYTIAASGWGFYVLVYPDSPLLFEEEAAGWRVIPFTSTNTTLVGRYSSPIINNVERTDSAAIDALVKQVDGTRWFSALTQLATYNRYTRGTGIAAAQQWIISQLQEISQVNANLTITTQPFSVGSTTAYNIIATFVGYKTPDDWVIVGGHYDSTSQSPTSSAPGAEDNASGAAGVLEMARVFATNPPPSTIILIFFSGEEQGLVGSTYHATQLVNNGDASKVRLMHNMDMIAYKAASNPSYNVLIEPNRPYDSFFPSYTTSATTYTKLELLYSTYAFGSDHEPYLNRGMPGILTIDGDWDSYPDYHRTTDTPSKCNQQLGFQILQMGVATIAGVLGY